MYRLIKPLTAIALIIVIAGLITYNTFINKENTVLQSLTDIVRGAGFIPLQAPPVEALSGNGTIPPLNTSNVYIIAYYKVNQTINLTKASEICIILHWGWTYFDGIYILLDPKNVPTDYDEAFQHSIVYVNVRVRSDGWILAWINKTQQLSAIPYSGRDIVIELGEKNPYVKDKVTTLSYAIWKILEHVDIVPDTIDALISVSEAVGYYDYKYCGPNNHTGFLAIIGVRGYTTGSLTKTFDFSIGSAFAVREAKLVTNYKIYLSKSYYGSRTISGWIRVYLEAEDATPDTKVFDRTYSYDCGYYPGCSHTDYDTRTLTDLDIESNKLYFCKLELSYSNASPRQLRGEVYIVILGELVSQG